MTDPLRDVEAATSEAERAEMEVAFTALATNAGLFRDKLVENGFTGDQAAVLIQPMTAMAFTPQPDFGGFEVAMRRVFQELKDLGG